MTTTECAIDGCVRSVTARGMCRMHYLQKWRAGAHEAISLRDRSVTVCPADHPHDLEGCWAEHGCRCARCAHLRRMERQRRRTRLRAYGQHDTITPPRVPAAPVAAHISTLQAQGFGLERIADAAGVSRSVVLDAVYGARGQKRHARAASAQPTVRQSYADRIMALRVDDIEGALLASAGTVRRLQALVTIGYSQTHLADLMSMDRGNFSHLILGYRDRVTVATATRAAHMFTEMWEQPAAGPTASRARRLAGARGWAGPLAWDDIDDPDERPEGVATMKTRTPGEVVLDDVAFLLEMGESPEQVAAAVERSVGAIAKLADRNGRRDLANTFGALDRRFAA